MTAISGKLDPKMSKDEKKAIIRQELQALNNEIPENVFLPTNTNYRVVGIVTTSGTPMQSAAKVPILVTFEVQKYEGPDAANAQIISNNSQKAAKQYNRELRLRNDATEQAKLQNAPLFQAVQASGASQVQPNLD